MVGRRVQTSLFYTDPPLSHSPPPPIFKFCPRHSFVKICTRGVHLAYLSVRTLWMAPLSIKQCKYCCISILHIKYYQQVKDAKLVFIWYEYTNLMIIDILTQHFDMVTFSRKWNTDLILQINDHFKESIKWRGLQFSYVIE